MEPTAKPNPARGFVIRLLLFGVAALLLRLVYVASVLGGSCTAAGDFCLFSSPETVTIPGTATVASAAFVRVGDGSAGTPALWTTREWRRAVDFYSATFQNLAGEGFLSPSSKSLCIGGAAGYEVLALKEIGVKDSVGISRKKSPPLVVSDDLLRQPFQKDAFDFVFLPRGSIENSLGSADLALEIERTAKPGGYIAIHSTSTDDGYSLQSLLDLFPGCRIVRSREINSPDSTVREIVLQKQYNKDLQSSDIVLQKQHNNDLQKQHDKEIYSDSSKKCSVTEHKLQLLSYAEPLIEEEPPKPWITLKRNIKNVKYLPTMADIRFKRRYVYVDVGARSYGSSIGSWFKKQYPKQNHTFEIYAIEADPAFHKEYAMRKGVKLLPYAAWIKNETLLFEINHDPGNKTDKQSRGMGRIQPSGGLKSGQVHEIQAFDFAEWLTATVTAKDFVVMKMDVEGTEFDLIPRLFETGAICLIDELFLECHYNRWQRCCPGERTPKYKNTYKQCLGLFTSLRDSGVLVHQWW